MAVSSLVPTSSREHPDLAMRSLDAAWDRARWERLPPDGKRYEVIDGVLYMSTAPSSFHQWIVQEAYALLRIHVNETGLGLTFLAPIGVFMPGCDPVQPDVVVVLSQDRGFFQEGRIVGVPALLLEVVSPGHPSFDTRIKREAYARAGVPEYWIVLPSLREVLVCSAPDAALGDYKETRRFAQDDEMQSPTLPVRFVVSSLFAGAPDTTL